MVYVVKVIYQSALADKIDEAINTALENGWPIEYIELTTREWHVFQTYLFNKASVIDLMKEMYFIDDIVYQGVTIKRED